MLGECQSIIFLQRKGLGADEVGAVDGEVSVVAFFYQKK